MLVYRGDAAPAIAAALPLEGLDGDQSLDGCTVVLTIRPQIIVIAEAEG
jgi:hypothetical protein